MLDTGCGEDLCDGVEENPSVEPEVPSSQIGFLESDLFLQCQQVSPASLSKPRHTGLDSVYSGGRSQLDEIILIETAPGVDQ